MGLIAKVLPLLLDWLYAKIVPAIIAFFKQKKAMDAIEEKQQDRNRQAERVESLRLKILKFKSKGKPVPSEIEDAFNEELRKLTDM